jgi:hypothetical protein
MDSKKISTKSLEKQGKTIGGVKLSLDPQLPKGRHQLV